MGSSYEENFLPFHFQSGGIAFGEWVSLFTVTFAVVIAHVISGVPFPSILTRDYKKPPPWHEYLVHYNPTSIIWRYIAIIDRRLRTHGWTNADMAAANALFWTESGWNGSEDMITESLHYVVKLPVHNRIEVLSFAMLQTIIVTVQGVNAVYIPFKGLTGGTSAYFFMSIAVDQIFFPLAIFGLIRLGAAFWLTDDYAYIAPMHGNNEEVELEDVAVMAAQQEADDKTEFLPRRSATNRLRTNTTIPRIGKRQPTSYWPSRIARLIYILVLGAIWAVDFVYVVIGNSQGTHFQYDKITTSLFLFGLFFLFMLTVTIAVFAFYYVLRERTGPGSTVIPCVSTTWYKAYTIVLGLFALTLLIITSLETRRVACGKFTTYPESAGGDGLDSLCPGLVQVGLGHKYSGLTNLSDIEGVGIFIETQFNGSCFGKFGEELRLDNSSLTAN